MTTQDIKETIMQEFRDTFVNEPEYPTKRNGWLVPYVNTTADHLESFLNQSIDLIRKEEQKRAEEIYNPKCDRCGSTLDKYAGCLTAFCTGEPVKNSTSLTEKQNV